MKLSPSTISRRAILATAATTSLMASAACSRSTAGDSAGGKALQMFVNMGADTPQAAAMNKIVASYQQETGQAIQVTAVSTGFENQMKVRLASKDIPDLFSTHGWSLLRYSSFLERLTDRSWAADVNPQLDSSMRDANGDIYAFPGETNVAGVLYSQKALAAAGVDAAQLTSWEAFGTAADALLAAGITPISCSGKDQGPAGHIADHLAIDTFTDEQLQAMKDGTFQADAYDEVLTRVAQWRDGRWFNPDYASASQDDMAHALADGTAGFAFLGTSLLSQALTYAPAAALGFCPLPPTHGAEPYLVGGEGNLAFGVSKTSTQKEAALAFLDHLAKPENAAALAESTGSAPGLSSVQVDFGSLASSYEAYVTPGKVPVKPYFDRVYLPNGAWDTVVATTDSVISGQGSVEDAVTQMQRQYETLYGQQ
ncbi:extracellular solute-binding protein [Kineococcus sp. R86509]|uniref:ABC transporter substrate-binding protein n=1 Tax=Kineococcus sp. R86509 TaxID=3093851 RepID=UPI0036D42C9D